jgi:hypothetical protein
VFAVCKVEKHTENNRVYQCFALRKSRLAVLVAVRHTLAFTELKIQTQ